MESLGILEKKIKNLLNLVNAFKDENNKLKEENSRLTEENIRLSEKIISLNSNLETVEGAVFENSKDLEELSQEKALTKMVVDDLIKCIDSLVEKEDSQ